MSNESTASLWIVNSMSLLAVVFGFVAIWLFLPALLVVFGVNPVKPGAHEFDEAFMWGLPLMVLANLMVILVLKWRNHLHRGFLQIIGFVLTLMADIALALLLVLR